MRHLVRREVSPSRPAEAWSSSAFFATTIIIIVLSPPTTATADQAGDEGGRSMGMRRRSISKLQR